MELPRDTLRPPRLCGEKYAITCYPGEYFIVRGLLRRRSGRGRDHSSQYFQKTPNFPVTKLILGSILTTFK